ncbi:MAG: GTPase HflX [Gammaproteobacteria bacterium]|nr:GTPase HflX [Gammaproteobacteria bacterium]MYC24737.1 GTPase HflX [Gammaproteobacteria bacterium]
MFFDRPSKGERTVLLSVRFDKFSTTDHDLVEFEQLADSAGLDVIKTQSVRRESPHPATCIGPGKISELQQSIQLEELDLLVLDHELTASQQRKLERELNIRVMTRTELILHVFEDRAQTHEGKLQVELAMLSHAQSRLVRGWTHLDRQRGGIGLRGVGETQISLDKRMLQKRVQVTQARLKKVQQQRNRQRQQRTRNRVPTVALVGYTNAGKSTLFNALTHANVYADDRLFATLDPTVRRLETSTEQEILLVDTVGFIRDLPVELVAAFRSTLEEVTRADLLLHVLDATEPKLDEVCQAVKSTLEQIGAADLPTITVFNKIDLAPNIAMRRADAKCVSARGGQGLEALRDQIVSGLYGLHQRYLTELKPKDGKIRSLLYDMHVVEHEEVRGDGSSRFTLNLKADQASHLVETYKLRLHG